MSADSGDSLRIPIEIKTDDLDEIRKLINEISQAKSDLQTLKAVPKKGRGTGDTSSRSAFTPSQVEEGRGGIFPTGFGSGNALPTQGRDNNSRTPFQRESEFAKLQTQVQEQQQRVGTFDAIQSGLGVTGQTAVNMATSGTDGKGFLLGSLGGLASKSFLPLTIITTIISIAKGVLDTALAPGGLMDRRFKRTIQKESLKFSSLKEKSEINFGNRIIRVTTIGSQRGGNSQVRSNLDYIKNGVDIFDVNGALHKGIGAGTI